LIHAGPDSFDEKEQFPWEEEAPLVVGMLVADVIRLQENKKLITDKGDERLTGMNTKTRHGSSGL
jgi:hypothetical protein